MFDHRFIVNFTKYKFLLLELVKRDISVKYKDSVLGIFWSFLNPVLNTLVLVIVFGYFFGSNIPYFPIYVVIGRLAFTFFSSSTTGSMNSIKGSAAIIKKIYVPKYIYALSKILSEVINFLISLVVLVAFMLVTNCPFSWFNLTAIFPMGLLFLFTIGCGLILASINVFFKDMKYLYGVFTTLLMYGCAIFYPITILPEAYKLAFYLNPVYCAISGFRDAVLYGAFPNLYLLGYQALTAVLALGIGILIFYKTQDKFILHI